MKPARTSASQFFVALLLIIIGLSTYGCADTGSISDGPEVRLANLEVTPGALSPAFSPTNTRYTVNVSSTTTTISLTATPQDNSTRMTIDGGTTQNLPGPGSSKDISIVLTSQSGSQSTYTITVNKAALADDKDLSALTVIPGTLTPAFNSQTIDYTVEVGPEVGEVTISATKSDQNATMTGSLTAGAGIKTGQATITLGGQGTSTPILIGVAAQNGAPKTYTITVKRAIPPPPQDNNNLKALTVSSGFLSPAFTLGTQTYTVNLSSNDTFVTITATKDDPNAVMSGGITAGRGVPTGQTAPISVGPGGITSILITVTAPNGASKEYSITISRAPAPR